MAALSRRYLPSITRNRGGDDAVARLGGGVGIAVDGAQLRGGCGFRCGGEGGLGLGEAGHQLLGLDALTGLDGGDGNVLDGEGQRRREELAVAGGAADHPVDVAEVAAQRHHQHGGAVGAGAVGRSELQLDDRGLVHHDVEQAVEADAVCLLYQERWLHAADLHAHHLADLHAGEADAHVLGRKLLDDEHVLERGFELAGIDLGAVGSHPPGAEPFPVGLERGKHEIVHSNLDRAEPA